MKTIEIKQKLVENALDQLKAAQQDSYVQSTQNVIDEIEQALRQSSVNEQGEQFYCADWNRCGTMCEGQCDSCNKAENMPEVAHSASDLEKELYELINAYVSAGLKKPDLVHTMEYVTQSCRVS